MAFILVSRTQPNRGRLAESSYRLMAIASSLFRYLLYLPPHPLLYIFHLVVIFPVLCLLPPSALPSFFLVFSRFLFYILPCCLSFSFSPSSSFFLPLFILFFLSSSSSSQLFTFFFLYLPFSSLLLFPLLLPFFISSSSFFLSSHCLTSSAISSPLPLPPSRPITQKLQI